MELNIIQKITIWGLPVLFAITVHEFAHGWTAWRCGDNTAKMLGRVSINPIRHIDLLGTIVLPILLLLTSGFVFGWAKPVPINTQALRQPKRDMILVALAGPFSNLLMALMWSVIFSLGYHNASVGGSGVTDDAILLMKLMGEAGVLINVMLMLFNLLPIPPLDGSRVVSVLLPKQMEYQYNLLEKYGFVILLGLIFLGLFEHFLSPWIYFVGTSILRLFL